jgi:hypothetical protein
MNPTNDAHVAEVQENTLEKESKEIAMSYLQLAFERTYKGEVGKHSGTSLNENYTQFSKRKNGTYANDRLQNIFQGFCLALQSINDSSISFSDLKTGNL